MSQPKVTVYYSADEGWMHVLDIMEEDMKVEGAMTCRSEILPYSQTTLNYFIARSKADPNIYVFEAKRV